MRARSENCAITPPRAFEYGDGSYRELPLGVAVIGVFRFWHGDDPQTRVAWSPDDHEA